MKKVIIILIGLLVIALVVLGILTLKKKNATNSGGEEVTVITPLLSPQIPTGSRINISGKVGERVEINNFLKSAVKIVEATVYLADTEKYSISYFSPAEEFLISLNAITFEEANAIRPAAEKDLLVKLGISKEDACKLKFNTKANNKYDEELSAADFGLSFCASGIPLPNNKNSIR